MMRVFGDPRRLYDDVPASAYGRDRSSVSRARPIHRVTWRDQIRTDDPADLACIRHPHINLSS